MIGVLLTLAIGAPTHAYALVVANNTASEGGMAPLHYADDDGAKYYELLSLFTEKTELLSVLDADTQRVFPKVAAIARPPSTSELDRASAAIFEKIAADEKSGVRTAFYFIYVGHGSITASGEGAMHLSDARFTRSDLFQKLIARSPARINHVIIDACNAYLMVARRGVHEEEDAAIKDFLSKEDLAKYPGTGVLVSTSKAEDVHEWSRFEAGIFSHEVRSALAGAADIDGDGAVTYDEVRAFLGAANGRVKDPKAKLDAFVRAPALRVDEPLFDKKAARGAPSVLVPGTLAGRRWLEDDRGVRYADLNVAQDGAVSLALVPSGDYYLLSDAEEIRLPADAMASIDAGRLARAPRSVATRGTETMSFQKELFSIPFGRAYYEGFRANAADEALRLELPPEEAMRVHRVVSGGLAVGALAAIATGIGFGIDAGNKARDYRSVLASDAELTRLHDASVRGSRTANVLYAVGGGMVAGAVITWFLFD